MIPRGKPRIEDTEVNEVLKCLDEGTLVFGPEIEQFEIAMAEYHQMHFGVSTSNGWSAIFLAIKALGIEGKEVIIPTTVCKSVWYAIVAAGCFPVLVDCNMEDFNVDVAEVEAKISGRTGAILAPHLRGIPSDLNDLVEIVMERRGKKTWPAPPYLIEDCAQSIGARFNNRLMGTFGDVSVFSFYPTKIMTSIDGGMILTNEKSIAQKAKSLRYQHTSNYFLPNTAYNFKLNNINAVVGLAQLEKLDYFIKERWQVYKMYNKKFRDGTRKPPRSYDDIYSVVAKMHPHKKVVPDKYMVVSDRKYGLETNSRLGKVMQIIKTVHKLHREFPAAGYVTEQFPRAEAHSEKLISFPIYVGLTAEDIDAMFEESDRGRRDGQ
jgi:perosamine synthetase